MASRWKAGSPDQEIGRLIKMKAKKLIKSPEYRNDPVNEIEQELHEKWFKVSARHNPERGDIVKFADVVLNNHMRNMIAARRTQKRHGYQIPDGEESTTNHPPNRAVDTDSDESVYEFDFDEVAYRIDVGRAMRKLRPDLRRVAEGLTEGGVTEVARSLKVSRMTVYKRIEEIRRHFQEWGLANYFNRPRETAGGPVDTSG